MNRTIIIALASAALTGSTAMAQMAQSKGEMTRAAPGTSAYQYRTTGTVGAPNADLFNGQAAGTASATPTRNVYPGSMANGYANGQAPTVPGNYNNNTSAIPGAGGQVNANGVPPANNVLPRPASTLSSDTGCVGPSGANDDFAHGSVGGARTGLGREDCFTVAANTTPAASSGTPSTKPHVLYDRQLAEKFDIKRTVVNRVQQQFGETAPYENAGANGFDDGGTKIVPGQPIPDGMNVKPVPASLGDLPKLVPNSKWVAVGNSLAEVDNDGTVAMVVYDALP